MSSHQERRVTVDVRSGLHVGRWLVLALALFWSPAVADAIIVNVKDYGAVGNGTTNDAAAVQAAHDALPATGGTLYFPIGIYNFATTRLNFSKPIVLVGNGWGSALKWDVTGLSDPGGMDRGVLNIRHTTSGSALDYVKLHDLAFDFGGTRTSTFAEGRRGVNIYRANNIEIRGCRFKGGVGEMVGLGNFDTPIGNRAWIVGNFFTDFAQSATNPNVFNALMQSNIFVQGTSPIEAGRDGVTILGNTFEDMNGNVKIASVKNFAVVANRFKDVQKTDPGNQVGLIGVAGQGSNAPSTDGVISGNTMENAATYNNQTGIYIIRGTSTIDNARISITGNTINGIRQGIAATSLLDSSVSANTLVGDGSGGGIVLFAGSQVLRNSVSGNTVRNFSARNVSPITNGPIQDQTGDAGLNVVGWNTQDTTLVLGASGRIDFANLDTTPSVRRPAGVYWVANTAPTTITQLDDGTIGQQVTLAFNDANTTITDGGNFVLNGNFVSSSGDTLTLVAQTATLWVEVSRSSN